MYRSVVYMVFLNMALGIAKAAGFEPAFDVGAGYKAMQMEFTKSESRTFKAEFNTLDLTWTAAWGRAYISFNHERSLNDAIANETNGVLFFSRNDSTVSMGYSLLQRVSAFAGFRIAETTAYYLGRDTPPSVQDFVHDRLQLKNRGFFLGTAVSYPVAETGVVAVSVALAKLRGVWPVSEPLLAPDSANTDTQAKAEAIGMNVGLNWVGAFTNLTQYAVGAKWQRADFDHVQSRGGHGVSYRENVRTVYLSLTRYF